MQFSKSQLQFHALGCPTPGRMIRHGTFVRKEDGVLLQRWRCTECRKTWSEATGHPFFRQHRRLINGRVAFDLASGVSQRRCAKGVWANRKTAVRKFLVLGPLAIEYLAWFNRQVPFAKKVEFDEMQTFEHTKCKPLSIPLILESKTRRILDLDVCSMPANGYLAKISVKKYGKRKDDRRKTRLELLKRAKAYVAPNATFTTDKHSLYPREIFQIFPEATHKTTKGRRGCVTGQGELKKGGFDPLFSLNHTCAMFRENVNRLKRRTWCTTKRPERLKFHLALYAVYHNLSLKL